MATRSQLDVMFVADELSQCRNLKQHQKKQKLLNGTNGAKVSRVRWMIDVEMPSSLQVTAVTVRTEAEPTRSRERETTRSEMDAESIILIGQ